LKPPDVIVWFTRYVGHGLVWLIAAVVCLLAAPRVQLFADAGNGWPLRYH